SDGDGVADMRTIFAAGLHSPFGMALSRGRLYVADTDALIAFSYASGQTRATSRPETVIALPAGDINHHWTKDVIAAPDGHRLYVTVGSNSNAGENGMAAEAHRAAVLQIDLPAHRSRVF